VKRINCRNANCSADILVTDLYVQVGLHEPNLESYIGNNESSVRVYIGLGNPPIWTMVLRWNQV
jgi:hypothetical protein